MAKSYRAGLTRGEIASYPLVPNCRYRLKGGSVDANARQTKARKSIGAYMDKTGP
jgi:hypothetical protein